MRRFVRSSLSRYVLIGALLPAFALRALIPAGYMPALGAPFAFELCPVGFPAQLLHPGAIAQHDHGARTHHGSKHPVITADSCPFGSASSGAGFAPDQPDMSSVFVAEMQPATQRSRALMASEKFCVQQPRAPPTLA